MKKHSLNTCICFLTVTIIAAPQNIPPDAVNGVYEPPHWSCPGGWQGPAEDGGFWCPDIPNDDDAGYLQQDEKLVIPNTGIYWYLRPEGWEAGNRGWWQSAVQNRRYIHVKDDAYYRNLKWHNWYIKNPATWNKSWNNYYKKDWNLWRSSQARLRSDQTYWKKQWRSTRKYRSNVRWQNGSYKNTGFSRINKNRSYQKSYKKRNNN